MKLQVETSIMTADSIKAYLKKAYGLEGDLSCTFFKQGVNDTYRVSHDKQVLYYRLYKQNLRNQSMIESELAYIDLLHREGIKVSRPIKCKKGTWIHRVDSPEGTRYGVLFDEAPGIRQDQSNEEVAKQLGELVGCMHKLTDASKISFNRPPIGEGDLIDLPLKYLEAGLGSQNSDYRSLYEIGKSLRGYLNRLPKEESAYGLCHGDLHTGNMHLDPHGRLTLFDFDCCGYGWRAYDLSVYKWMQNMRRNEHNAAEVDGRVEAFIRAYQSIRPLKEWELEAIDVFVLLRHFWVVGLHGQISRNVGSFFMDDGYFTHKVNLIKDLYQELQERII